MTPSILPLGNMEGLNASTRLQACGYKNSTRSWYTMGSATWNIVEFQVKECQNKNR